MSRIVAGRGAQRLCVKSSSFWEGSPHSFVSAGESTMTFSEKWDTLWHTDALFSPIKQAAVIITLYLFLQAKYKSARIIGAYRLAAQETNLITLGTDTEWREVRPQKDYE